MSEFISWGGVACLLEAVVLSAFFERQGVALVLILMGIALTVAAIALEEAEQRRKRGERRQRKHRRYYQGEDTDEG